MGQTTHLFKEKLGLNFPFFAAPMVGISHVAFRHLISDYTPPNVSPLKFTEMLSSRRLPSEKLETSQELRVMTGETNFVPQILGNEERFLRPSVTKLEALNPWGFDINMGCPQTHILKHNWGVRLLGDPDYAADVVRIMKQCTSRPVSVKLRGGADEDVNTDYLIRFTDKLEEAGVDFITIHPRPRKATNHQGKANWDVASQVQSRRSIPICVNGDIQIASDAIQLVQEQQIAGAMIARSLTVRPWIFWQIAQILYPNETPSVLDGRKLPQSPEEEGLEYFRAFLRYIQLIEYYFGSTDFSLQKARFFAAIGSKWFLFGHSFWRITMKSKSLTEMSERVNDYLSKFSGVMYQRVDL